MRGILTLPILYGLLVAQPSPELVVSVGHAGAPSHAAFVGPYLATAEWSNVALIDLESGLTVAHLPQGSLVVAIEASPSGDLLAVGSCDHSIQLWDVRSRRLVGRLSLQQECAESISFSPDGTLLATTGYGCCSGKGLQVWDVRTGELSQVLAGDAKIRHVVFGGNGLWVAGIDDGGRASVFEWPSARELRTIAGFVDSGSPEAGVITSRDGAYFGWFGFESGIRVWDVASGEEVSPTGQRASEEKGGWNREHITTAAFLDDGRLAYVTDEDEMIRMRLPKGPREKKRLAKRETEFFGDVGLVQPQSWIKIRKDGALIAGSRDTRTVVWEVARARLFELTAPALVYPSSLSWSRSGIVAWADLQSGALGWDDRKGVLVAFGGGATVVDAIAFSPDGEQMAVAGSSSMTIFDVASRRTVASSRSVSSVGTAVAFSQDGSRLAFGSAVRGFDLFDANLRLHGTIAVLEGTTTVERAAFSPDGRWVAAGLSGANPSLHVWPVAALASSAGVTLDSDDVTYGPQPPAFRDDSRFLASFCQGRALTIWRIGSWEVARTWNLSDSGNALEFAPEGSRLAVASDSEAAIWDSDTGEKVLSFATPGSSEMKEIAWSPDGKRIVTSADDGVLRFWNSGDGGLLASLYVLDTGRDWLLVAPDGRVDGSQGALDRLVAWRIDERARSDSSVTKRYRVRGLWRSIMSSSR